MLYGTTYLLSIVLVSFGSVSPSFLLPPFTLLLRYYKAKGR